MTLAYLITASVVCMLTGAAIRSSNIKHVAAKDIEHLVNWYLKLFAKPPLTADFRQGPRIWTIKGRRSPEGLGD